jgi:hypothetical protein
MTRAAIKEWLRAVPLFSELSPEELDMLVSRAWDKQTMRLDVESLQRYVRSDISLP